MTMDFETAFAPLARSAGDPIANFLGEPRDRVPEQDIKEAGRFLLAEMNKFGEPIDVSGRSEEDQVSLMIQETKAQVLEAWRHSTGKRHIKRRRYRSEVLAFLEGQTGRPMPALVGAYG